MTFARPCFVCVYVCVDTVGKGRLTKKGLAQYYLLTGVSHRPLNLIANIT